MRTGQLYDVGVEPSIAVLAGVGQRMGHNKGIAATTFDALAKANVNIQCDPSGSANQKPEGETSPPHSSCVDITGLHTKRQN